MPRETPANLEDKINHNNWLLESLCIRVELFDQHLVRLAENVEAIVEQAGRFTEGLTRLENLITITMTPINTCFTAFDSQIGLRLSAAETRREHNRE